MKNHEAQRMVDARMMTLDQGSGYTGMGKTYFKKWATEIGARVYFSPRLVRYDREIIDKALDDMRGTVNA